MEQTLTTYAWRPAQRADLPGILDLLRATSAASGNTSLPTLADLEREWDDEFSDPATDSQVVLDETGRTVAYARLFANPRPEEELRCFTDDEVHPDHEAELHDAVLDWLEARARAKLAEIAAATGHTGRRLVRVGAAQQQTERLARYARHGFAPIRYFFRMRRDLGEAIPDRPLPAGLRLTTYAQSPDLDERLRAAFNESFRDHWSFEAFSARDWQQFIIGRDVFRPDLTFIVLDGGDVAAFSINRVDPEETARQGYSAGWIGTLGTRRAWRKRGLASALIVESMRAFKAEGLQFAALGVDAHNLTGALGLYESLGFVSYRKSVHYEKDA
jgi:ribosomal protein S18 acetylase RimI-like enzyme